MFLFCLGKFFHAFPRLAEFSQGRGRRIPWEKTEAQYLNIKQVYKFSAESTKELKRLFSNVGFLYNLIRQNLQKS